MQRLDFYVGYELQASIKLEADEITLGRDASCMVQMPDERVSRLHALIKSVDNEHWIENHGANGTRVNNRKIDAPYALKPGDAIFIASYILVYQLEGAPVSDMASTVLAT